MVYGRCCCKSNTSKEDVDDAFANLTNDCWTECMLESVPQFILQLMIFLRKPTIPGKPKDHEKANYTLIQETLLSLKH